MPNLPSRRYEPIETKKDKLEPSPFFLSFSFLFSFSKRWDLVFLGQTFLHFSLKARLEVGQAVGEGAELLFAEAEDVHRFDAPDGRAAGGLVEEGHLAEIFPGTHGGDDCLALRRDVDDDLGFARQDHVDAVADVSLVEHFLPRLVMFLLDRAGPENFELDQVRREEEVEKPRDGDLDAAVEARQFHQVDHPPEQPRENPGELEPHDFRHAAVMAQGTHFAQAGKAELFSRPATDGRDDVVRGDRGLAHPELRRGRAKSLAGGMRDQGAVPDGPDVVAAFDLSFQIAFDFAPVFRNIEGVDDRIRRRRHGRNQRPGRDPLSGREDRLGFGRRRQPGFEPDIDPAFREDPLGEQP